MIKVLIKIFAITFISCTTKNIEREKKENIDIPFYLHHQCLSLNACLNSSIYGEFALDNGMGISLLDSAFFYSNFDLSNYKLVDSTSYYYFQHQEYIGEITVKIGNYYFTLTNFLVKNCNKLGIPDLNGIIGINAFLDKITSINFDSQTISFFDTLPSTINYNRIPLLPSKNKMIKTSKFIEVALFDTVGKKISGHLQFDLGCNGVDLLVKKSFARLLRKTIYSNNKEAILATVQKANTKFWKLETAHIGKFYLTDIQLATTCILLKGGTEIDAMSLYDEGDGYVGFNLLKRFNIIIDYKNNFLYVKPSKFYK